MKKGEPQKHSNRQQQHEGRETQRPEEGYSEIKEWTDLCTCKEDLGHFTTILLMLSKY